MRSRVNINVHTIYTEHLRRGRDLCVIEWYSGDNEYSIGIINENKEGYVVILKENDEDRLKTNILLYA